MLIIFAIAFVLSVGEQLYWRMPGIGFWSNLWHLITYHLSWEYFRDINYGFIEDVKQVLAFLPHLVIAALLYLAYKANGNIGRS